MAVSTPPKVAIIGIGDDGIESLPESARRKLAEADVILGTDRTLATVGAISAEKIAIGADLGQLVQTIEAQLGQRRLVVLASGDPLFYGVARYLTDRFGKEFFEVVPHVSSMQLAFARVMESWDDAYLTNVANHPLEQVLDRIRTAEKVGLFTSETLPPNRIARALLDDGISYFRAYVCENLGSRHEIVTRGTLAEIADMEFSSLNVMILVREPDQPDRAQQRPQRRLFGNPDDAFRQSRPKKGLLTPAEVRVLALAELHVGEESVVWDVGAGSGSVSIEAAQLARRGRVYAIEPDLEDCELIRDNARAFEVTNVEVIAGRAPEVFERLPTPDAVFIGGTGRETVGILARAYERLSPGGALVANVASIENVSAATATLRRVVPHVGLLMVNLSRGIHQLESIRFEAVNPSFLIAVQKKGV